MAIHLGVDDGLTGLKMAGNSFLSGIGTATALVSAAALVAIGGLNSYGASLSVLTSLDSFRRVKPTRRARVIAIVGCVVLYYVIGLSIKASASDTINTLLTLMLYLVVPWSAINLLDFYVVRRGHYSLRDLLVPSSRYGIWNWRGLTSYAVGFVCEIPFMILPAIGSFEYTGPVAKQLSDIDISWIVGLAASGACYLLLTRRIAARESIPADDPGLRPEEGEPSLP